MTLVEVLIAILIFVIAAGALISSISATARLISEARDQTIASNDLRSMMEKIRSTAFDTITTRFPNTVVNGPGGTTYQNYVGSYALSNENITVSYTNVNSDPLEIKVVANWRDRINRLHNTTVSTFRTR